METRRNSQCGRMQQLVHSLPVDRARESKRYVEVAQWGADTETNLSDDQRHPKIRQRRQAGERQTKRRADYFYGRRGTIQRMDKRQLDGRIAKIRRQMERHSRGEVKAISSSRCRVTATPQSTTLARAPHT